KRMSAWVLLLNALASCGPVSNATSQSHPSNASASPSSRVVAEGVVSCVRPPTPGHNFALLSAPPTTLVLDVSNPAAPESICRLSVDGAHFVSASELVFMGAVKGNAVEGRIDLNNQTATVSFTLATRGDSLVPAPAWTRNGD